MAAVVIRDNAKAISLTGLAGVRAKTYHMVQRAMACAAATVLICAVAAALVQLAAELLSLPAPIMVTAMTLMAAALLNSLCRHRIPGACRQLVFYRLPRVGRRAHWANEDRWTRISILSTAGSGFFSCDRAIRDYCRDIWHPSRTLT